MLFHVLYIWLHVMLEGFVCGCVCIMIMYMVCGGMLCCILWLWGFGIVCVVLRVLFAVCVVVCGICDCVV